MFSLFKKKSEEEILQATYQKLIKESYDLSHRDRKAADLKAAEADEILRKLEALRAAK